MSITWGSVSGWWAPVCLLLGVLYAWPLYRQPVSLSNKFRYLLFALRALAVFIIAFLLLTPLVKTVSYKPEKPLVLILQDNSQSVNLFKPHNFEPGQFIRQLAGLKQTLGNNYEVHEFNFGPTLNNGLSNKFNGKITDISSALKQLNNEYVNRNIGAVILATDGLYNQGADPRYEARNFKTTFYTIALGDTTPKRDLLIANVNYNKTAFLGNDFVIGVLAEAYQSKGETMHLTVTEDGRQVAAQNIPVNSDAFQKLVPVKLNADKKGIRRFGISISPVKNELSLQNNTETIYVQVLDTKQKILLLYDAPNPDISVIKQDIESDRNYDVKPMLVSGLAADKINGYSLVILYQLPSAGLSAIMKSKLPLWFMVGGGSELADFNSQQTLVKIYGGGQQMQEVFAQPAAGFSAFTLSDSTVQKISGFPPLLAPFGTYTSSPANQVLFKQKIGEVATTYPLLSFAEDDGRRVGILTGEGLWRWQLAGYKAYGNHHALDELLTQAVQYLTANANRQQFRVYPAKDMFDEGEDVILNAELYNDALELVNTPDVSIDLKSDTGGRDYSFLFTRTGQSYQLNAGALPPGDYSYRAQTKLGDRQFTAAGHLTIRSIDLETRQSAANHQLLSDIARQSGGQMLLPPRTGDIASLIRKNDNVKTIVYEDKNYSDLVNIKWVFALILALLSAEWFIRKREGEI